MDFSFVYLARRFYYRFLDFFHHWYIDGSRAFGRRFVAITTARPVNPIAGGIFFACISIVFTLAYLVWIAIPAVIIYYVARNL